MEIKRGIPVSPGVVIGPALVLDTEGFRIPQRFIDGKDCDREVERLHKALSLSAADARKTQQDISDKVGKKYGAIFSAHAMLMEDPELVRELENLICDKHHSAEYATSRVIRRHAKTLSGLDSGVFGTRAADLFDIEKTILHN